MWIQLIIIVLIIMLVFFITKKEGFCPGFQKVDQINYGVAPTPVYNCPMNYYPENPINDPYRPYQPKYAYIATATW